jgi:hypothetical protein
MGKCTTSVIAITVFIALLLWLGLGIIFSYGANQSGFILNLDEPLINYTLQQFSDADTSKEFEFENSSDKRIFYLSIPESSLVYNISMNFTGKLTSVYEAQISSNEVAGLSVGNATGGEYLDIAIGTKEGGHGRVRLISGNNGTVIWNSASFGNYQIYSTDIGELDLESFGEEIAAGSQDGRVYILNSSGGHIWNYSTGNSVVAAAIADLDLDSKNEVIIGSDKIYALNSSGSLIWNTTLSGIKEISVGNLSLDFGADIAVGCSAGKLYALNSTGGIIQNLTIGSSEIRAVAIADVSSSPGNEIIVGNTDGEIYIVNSSWEYAKIFTAGSAINSIKAEDVTGDYPGSEIVVGSNDQKIYILNSTGSPIGDFLANNFINAVGIGGLAESPGLEAAAGGADGTVYIFNFDYFPTNLSIDVGNNGNREWVSGHEKLRGSEVASGDNITDAINTYLEACSPDASGNCQIPLAFESKFKGMLNIGSLSVSYLYNVSGLFQKTPAFSWSRISNISAGESVGYSVYNITFSGIPSENLSVYYLFVNQSATACDFNFAKRSVADIGGSKVCNITLEPLFFEAGVSINSSESSFLFWDDTMESQVAIHLDNLTDYFTEYGEPDRYTRQANLSLYTDNGSFLWASADWVVNDSQIKGEEFLRVFDGGECDITPPDAQDDCDSEAPEFTYQKTCSQYSFFSCKKETGDGMYFRWAQSSLSSDAPTLFQAGGSYNLRPELSNLSAIPNSSIWGTNITFSADLYDEESDGVNATLWIYHSGNWHNESQKSVLGSILQFNVTSAKEWVGVAQYLFEYYDYNLTGLSQIFHLPQNTTAKNFTIEKHNSEVIYSPFLGTFGNATSVYLNNTAYLSAYINDTDLGEPAVGASCALWVGEILSGTNLTNSTGHCNIVFLPNQSYSVGEKKWKIGILGDGAYSNSNSTELDIEIRGELQISIIGEEDMEFYRGMPKEFGAQLQDVYGRTPNLSNYNCSFNLSGSGINSNIGSNMTLEGACAIYYAAGCGGVCASVGEKNLSVQASRIGADDYYDISGFSAQDMVQAALKDSLVVSVHEPEDLLYYKGSQIPLNATAADSCSEVGDVITEWSLINKNFINVTVTDISGSDREDYPIILGASLFSSEQFDIGSWIINNTKITLRGEEIPFEIYPWSDEGESLLNNSQENMSEYSKIVFLADLPASSSKTFEIDLRYYNPEFYTYNVPYSLRNAGFGSGNFSYWTESACSSSGCGVEVSGSGGMRFANLSAGNGLTSIFQGIPNHAAHTGEIQIKYKAWGEFGHSLYPGELYIQSGDYVCNLTPSILENADGEGYVSQPSNWTVANCADISLRSAQNISIILKDMGDGGADPSNTNALIDYICFADAFGECVSFHSGLPDSVEVSLKKSLGSAEEYLIGGFEEVGRRKAVAIASKDYYTSGYNSAYFNISGFAKIGNFTVDSEYCSRWGDEPFRHICMSDAHISLEAEVLDNFTLSGIYNYSVGFYNESGLMGSNYTGVGGIAEYFTSVGNEENYTYTANISSMPGLFYEAVEPKGLSLDIIIDNGTTAGSIELNNTYETASGVALDNNHTFMVYLNLTNTGSSGMYAINISSTESEGIIIPKSYCSPLPSGNSCGSEINITVTVDADATQQVIVFNASWRNGDGSNSSTHSNLTISIPENKRAVFYEESLYLSAPITAIRSANFTVVNYGNVNLTGVYYNISGTDAGEVADWSAFMENASNIAKKGERENYIRFEVPGNDTLIGVYFFNITATIPDCSVDCSVTLPFTLNVTSLDWYITPDTNLSRVVGLKEELKKLGEFNLVNVAPGTYNYNVTVSPQAGTSAEFLVLNRASGQKNISFSLQNQASRTISVYYNTSVSPESLGSYIGKHNYTIRARNLNESAVPQYVDLPVYFEIINFTVDIISPAEAEPIGGVYENDTLEIIVEAISGNSPVSEGMAWSAEVGGVVCLNEGQAQYNATSEKWLIECFAPEIPSNRINNSLTVTGIYSREGGEVELSDIEENAVIYEDVLPPWFSRIASSHINYFSDAPTQSFRVNVTDNLNISSVWAEISAPSGPNISLGEGNFTKSPISDPDFESYEYIFSFANPNEVGDYDIFVYANDTGGRVGIAGGWFEVYRPITAAGNLSNPKGEGINATFRFYRAGHNRTDLYFMGSYSVFGGDYSWALHKRKYDVVAEIFGHEIALLDADFNIEPNTTDSPFKFDNFPHKNSEDMSNILLPDTANRQSILLAVVVESALNLSGAEFSINYTEALGQGSFSENLLKAFYCQNWNYTTRSCSEGEFSYLEGGYAPEIISNIFNFSTNHLSAYAVAESSYPDKWGVSPPAPDPGTSPAPGGSAPRDTSSGISEPRPFCGNGICEIGENADNCPQDCSRDFPLEVDTNLEDARIFLGESKEYWISLGNLHERDINATISLSDNMAGFISMQESRVQVPKGGRFRLNLSVTAPLDQAVGTYGGYVILEAEGKKKSLPITLRLLESAKLILKMDVEIPSQKINAGKNLSFVVKLVNLGDRGNFELNIDYLVIRQSDNKIVKQFNTSAELESAAVLRETLELGQLETGYYNLEVWANYNDKSIMDVASFEIVKPLFESPLTVALLLLALAMAVLVGGTYIWNYYRAWKKEKEKQERYLYPLDYNAVPKSGFRIGKFAGRDNVFYYDPRDLSTHIIAAGATGSGKSVTASVFAEEALDRKLPVIVFDPTAQWTGFVKPLKDKNLLARYRAFGMNDYDIKSYPGLIYDIDDPNFKLDVKKFINPGEITVFCLNRLKPGEYDIAVKNIISTLFSENWEESTELKAIFVFDEVHRLLEKYGGSGGYTALEKAAREFRKWGLGVIMCSQVLADFKEAIAGNVLTEVQLNTKSLADISKVKTKYGERYAERITRMGVGAGLFQHPKYNSGKPFFVEFRPTKHDPHKITDQELTLYKEYTERLDKIGEKIAQIKSGGGYVENYEIDYKLALNKLKRGNFRMSEIYISSLEKALERA